MDHERFSLLPGLIWKIEGVVLNQYGKISGPVISILGSGWKLKFYYLDNKDGATFSIILTKIEGVGIFSSMQFTTYFYKINSATELLFKYSHHITDAMSECLIWESKVSHVQKLYYFDDFFKTFIFCFNTGGCVLKSGEEHLNEIADSRFVPYSPCIESLCQDFGSLYNNILLSDVVLECGGKKVYAHRIILAARSKVFAGMFRNDMSESKKGHVQIEDIEPLILEKMVRYLYSGDAGEIDFETTPKLYAAADKYCVDGLKMKCGTIMVEKKQPDSGIATMAPNSSACGNSINSIRHHFNRIKDVLETKEWKKLSEKEPKFAYKAFQYFVRESTA